MNFYLTNKAVSDIKNIAKYTEKQWGKRQRNQYLKQLDDSFYAIARDPNIGRNADDIADGYKKYLISKHLVLLRLKNEQSA